jgi:hypothetical protein
MAGRHIRFPLADVTLDGTPVGGATVDQWTDAQGRDCWSARLLMPASQAVGDGVLEGTTRDGRRLRGRAQVGETHPGPGSARIVLVELLGREPLIDGLDSEDQA